MSNELKQELQKVKKDLKSVKTLYKQIPNFLTISRILMIIPINILFFTGNISSSFTLSCIAFASDGVDGLAARILKAKSKLGADLDALCDKLLIAGIAIPMIILNPIMIINIILEGLISIPNIKAKMKGQKPKSSYIGKTKTVILSLTVLAGYILTLKNINLSFLQSLIAITPAVIMQIATLTGYVVRNKNENNITKNNSNNINELNVKNNKKEAKEKQKEKVYGPATLEELKSLKEELLIQYNEKNYQKTKNRFKN